MGFLSSGESLHAVWQKVRTHAEERLQNARLKLEAPTLSHEQSGVLRGRILELKHLLNADKDDPEIKDVL